MLKQANLSFSVTAQANGNDTNTIQFSTQDKKTAKLIFTIKEGKEPLNLTDIDGEITLVMQDKSRFVDKTKVTKPLDGIIEYTLTQEQIRHAGRAQGEVVLKARDGSSVGGFRFNFTIKKALMDEDLGPVKDFYIQDLEAVKQDVKKKAEVTASELNNLTTELATIAGNLEEEYQNKAYTVDEKLADVQATVTDLRKNGTGIDAQARMEVERVGEQLVDIAIVLKPLPNGIDNAPQINNALQKYNEVILSGGEYYVEKVAEQSYFIKMLSNKKLTFRNGARLKIKNTNSNFYQIIQCWGVDNWVIENPYVLGDYGRNTSPTGAWGEGITVYGCKNFTILNMRADDCFGSGLMLAAYKPNGDESVIIHNENGYISRVHVENSKFQGVSMTDGINIKIDEIYAKNITQMLPACAIDIETDFHYAVLKNINIGKVVSIDCRGGVDILPAKYREKATADQISINIGDIVIENQGRFRIIGLNGGKIYGYINVNNVMCYNTNNVLVIDYVPPEMTVNIKNVKGQNVGVLNDTNEGGANAPVYLENTNTADYTRNVSIDNIELIEKSSSLASVFLKDAFTGEINKSCFIKNIKATKPMKIHSRNSYEVKGDVKLNAIDFSAQGWFNYHFWGTHYVNNNATANKTLNVSGHFSGFKQTLEVTTEGQYLGFTFGNSVSIYPTPLAFVHGFRSNKKGSKIVFTMTKPNEVVINEIVGIWESITI